jgi:hypothetical protein
VESKWRTWTPRLDDLIEKSRTPALPKLPEPRGVGPINSFGSFGSDTSGTFPIKPAERQLKTFEELAEFVDGPGRPPSGITLCFARMAGFAPTHLTPDWQSGVS